MYIVFKCYFSVITHQGCINTEWKTPHKSSSRSHFQFIHRRITQIKLIGVSVWYYCYIASLASNIALASNRYYNTEQISHVQNVGFNTCVSNFNHNWIKFRSILGYYLGQWVIQISDADPLSSLKQTLEVKLLNFKNPIHL